MFDLAKETKGIMMLEQETNALDIVFFMGSNPRVSKKTHAHTKNACMLTDELDL